MAYDIHDGLVQYLTGALMHLEAFAASAYAASDDAHPDYDRGIDLLREALAEGRRLISGLRPPILDERGIVAALEYLVSEVRPEIPQIEFMNNTQFGRLTPAIEVAIFRIAQEAITNVRLHSGAQRAKSNSCSTANGSAWPYATGAAASIPPPFRRNASDSKVFDNAPDYWALRPSSKCAPGQGTVLTVDFPLIQEKPMATGEHSPSVQH